MIDFACCIQFFMPKYLNSYGKILVLQLQVVVLVIVMDENIITVLQMNLKKFVFTNVDGLWL